MVSIFIVLAEDFQGRGSSWARGPGTFPPMSQPQSWATHHPLAEAPGACVRLVVTTAGGWLSWHWAA